MPSYWAEAAPPPDSVGGETPVSTHGSIRRTALVNRLRTPAAGPVVTMVAPAGYGKTTTLTQWAERDERPFAWVSCDADDDARRLCMRIASALDQSGSLDKPALASIRARRSPAVAVRELVAAFTSLRRPAVLVLDGADLIRKKGCADLVAALALHVPDGSTLALAGRALPRGPIARLRAGGSLFEVGREALALTRRETERLVRGLGVELEAEELDELSERAEGWPTGVYLAALALKDGGAGASMPGGDDRFVTDYLDFELLSRLGPKDVRFLTRTSVLDAMCGPLCDTILESEGSGRKLAAFDRANLFLVPLDRRRRSYRYHREFRDFLRAELERREPTIVPLLYRRASAWCEEHGEPEAAIAYAHAAGDTDRVASLVGRHGLAAWAAGKRDAVETWLGWFDESHDLERHPEIAVLESWVHAVAGRAAASERWLALAERATLREPLPDGSASIEPWLAVMRATRCVEGPERMRADAELALRTLGPASGWRPSALVLQGAAHLLLGEDEVADSVMAEAAEEAESVGVVASRIVALSQRSLLAAARGDEARSAELGREARDARRGARPRELPPQRPGPRRVGSAGGAARESREGTKGAGARAGSRPAADEGVALVLRAVGARAGTRPCVDRGPGRRPGVAGARGLDPPAAARVSESSSTGGPSSRSNSSASRRRTRGGPRRSPPPSCACSRSWPRTSPSGRSGSTCSSRGTRSRRRRSPCIASSGSRRGAMRSSARASSGSWTAPRRRAADFIRVG